MVFIDCLCVLLSYVDKQGEIWTDSIALTKDKVKKNYIEIIHGSFTSRTLMIVMRTLPWSIELLFLSIRMLCIILNLKKQKYWKKERQRFTLKKKAWNFCRK
jgi:hypothetical protein